MLLGVEKKRKEEEQLETTFALRSQASGFEHGGTGLFIRHNKLHFYKICAENCFLFSWQSAGKVKKLTVCMNINLALQTSIYIVSSLVHELYEKLNFCVHEEGN